MMEISTRGHDAVQASDAFDAPGDLAPHPSSRVPSRLEAALWRRTRSRRAAPWAAAVATGFGIGLIVVSALLR